jgi:prefoldin alpha subunit
MHPASAHKMDKNAKQEKMIELQLIKQHMSQLRQQAEILEQQKAEVTVLAESLAELREIKNEKELLVPLAQGVFVRSKISGAEEFLVNVGSGVVVKKSAEDTISLMMKQAEEIGGVISNIAEKMNILAYKAASIEEKKR